MFGKFLAFLKGLFCPPPTVVGKSRFGRVYDRLPDPADVEAPSYELPEDPYAIPTAVDLRPLCSPVFDQGQVGSCTGNAAAGAFEFLQLKELKAATPGVEEFDPSKYDPASRLFIYYNERRLDHDTEEDAGATLHDAVCSLLYYGCCPESVWPYVESQALVEPSEAAYQAALSHKISKYYRFADLEHIKHSIASGYPVIIGISIYESFESDEVAATGLVPMPGPNEQYLGGHAVMIVGYDDTKGHVIVRNSWGTSWGDKGYFYLPYEYMNDPNLSEDFWSIRK
jgi:C1A family cysteine protease